MVKTFGFDEFIAELGDLEDKFNKESTQLLTKTGNEVVADAHMLTPVGVGTPHPGTLRRSLGRGEVEDYSIEVGFDDKIAPYAKFVEEGHYFRNRKGFVLGRWMMRDSVTMNEKKFKKNAKKMYADITRELKLW